MTTTIPWKEKWSEQEQTPKKTLEKNHHRLLQAIQRNIVLQSIWEVFRVFCRETNLHGMKHIFGSKTDYSRWHKRMAVRISRWLWLLSCVAGLYCGVLMMTLVWRRFQKNPTITTIDTYNHPIWEVAFPSVTICNNNKVYAPHTDNITRILIDRGIAIDRIYKFYELIPNLINPQFIDDEFLNISSVLQSVGYTPDTLMFELAQPCDQLLKLCFWMGTEYPCHELFKLSRSTEGICCSFNYKALKQSLEADKEFSLDTQKIYYVSGAGRDMGLNVLLDVETKYAMAMSKSIYGADVLIHDAEEFPQASLTSAVVQPGQEVSIAVVPSVISSRASIRSIPVIERQCYFADEEKLRATRKYSLNSCLAECRVDFILSKCHCLPFFYPEIPSVENKDRQCGLSDVGCLRMYRTIFSSMQPPDGTPGFNTSEEIGMNCTCYPACSETTYGLHTIDVKRDHRLRSWLYPNMDLSNMTSLLVYFKDLNCIRYRRDVYMTWDGLFASFGGIFGLCLGGSILSLVEMAYFFTVRLSLIIFRRIVGTKTTTLVGGKPPIQLRATEGSRQQERFQQAFAESRRIYNLSPVLNQHFKEAAAAAAEFKKKQKRVQLAW